MKIAYINQSYPPMISGASIVVESLANNMSVRGHSTLVIAASDKGPGYTTENDNLRIVRLASIPNPKRAYQQFAPGSFSRITRELKTFRPDIIHIHDLLSMGIVGLHIGRKMNIPVVATIHQLPWFICAYLPPVSRLKDLVEKYLWVYSRWLNKRCECMIVPTRTISKTIESRAGFQTIDISNGVDLTLFTPTPTHSREADHLYDQLGLDPEKPIILHVGRLDVDKRVEVVIRAASQALEQIDAQLLVVGDGECRGALLDLVTHLGIGERSYFTGFLNPKTEIPAIYRIASVFTTASDIETQGLVLLEAIASGLPVVAVEATCIPEIIKHNINGFLVQPGDVNALADKLVETLNNPSRGHQMGKIGRLIAQGHSMDESMDKHEDLYKSVVKAYQRIRKPKPAITKVPEERKIIELYQKILDQLERS